MGDETDLLPGLKLVECFNPFFFTSPDPACRRKPFKNMSTTEWVLGEEILRDLQEAPKLGKTPMHELVDTVLENDGPLRCHCDSEEQQNSIEPTCHKLRRFRAGKLSSP